MLQVKIIDEEHELDCMETTNAFLAKLNEEQLISLQYTTSHFESGENQIYSFSVCILYRIEDEI